MMEHLATNTRKVRFAVQTKMMKMGALTPELKVRLGNTLIRPVGSFACQIWAVIFLQWSIDWKNLIEHEHVEFLKFVTGSASFVAHGVLREEACSLPYHAHWAVLVCRQWNSLSKSVGSLGHLAWKDNVDMYDPARISVESVAEREKNALSY